MNYHVADFILRIKNASLANRKEVTMPYSNINKSIAKVLKKEGFLADTKEEEVDGKRVLRVQVRYERRKPVVTGVKVVSKPSLRVYVGAKEIGKYHVRDAMTSVFSTSTGILTGKEALKKGVGGELLFRIW